MILKTQRDKALRERDEARNQLANAWHTRDEARACVNAWRSWASALILEVRDDEETRKVIDRIVDRLVTRAEGARRDG